jgi:hypothetical protein
MLCANQLYGAESPSSEAKSHSASPEITHLLWNPKVHYRFHTGPYVEPHESSPHLPYYLPNSPRALTEHQAMKAYWGSENIAPRILDLGIRWRWVVSFTPRPLYPQRKRWYPLDRRLSGTLRRLGRGGEKNSEPLPGLEPPIIQPVAMLIAFKVMF